MNAALGLARRGLGRVWPNPAVGCVLVKDGHIIGSGWTGQGGRPHAEFEALKMASGAALGATAYVTLEPCAHHGETPSCARLLAEAGVVRVVYAATDPDPRTLGKGAEMLEREGVLTAFGLCQGEAKDLNRGFFLKTLEDRPLTALKLAASRDGKIASHEGRETRITGDAARAYSHRLRASHDAILVGIGTALADDPDLTCRVPGLEAASPVRIILDTTLRLPERSQLAQSARQVPVWLVTEAKEIPGHLKQDGIEIIQVKNIKNISQVLEKLAKKGITRLLVEGGATVNTSFLESGLVDHIYWFKNPEMMIGPAGVPAFRGLDIKGADDLKNFRVRETQALGQDVVEILEILD